MILRKIQDTILKSARESQHGIYNGTFQYAADLPLRTVKARR